MTNLKQKQAEALELMKSGKNVFFSLVKLALVKALLLICLPSGLSKTKRES